MKKLFLLLAGIIISYCLQGQTNSIEHMDVYIKPCVQQNTTIQNNDTTTTAEVLYEPQMFIVLADTNNIDNIQIWLGTTDGGNDIIEKTFSYNNEGEFPDGTSFKREGMYLQIYLGKYSGLSTYYAKARATINGTQQAIVSYNQQ